VSLAPEGYRLYPIDVEQSWATFQELTAFAAGKTSRTFAGKPLYVKRATPMPVDPELVAKLRAEVLWIKETSPAGLAALGADWPDGVPTFRDGGPTDADQCFLLAALVERVKKDCNVPFNPADNPPPAERAPLTVVSELKAAGPDEGGAVPGYADIADDLAALPIDCHAWVERIAHQAHQAGMGISLKVLPSERRYHIAHGLIILAPHGEDELLKAIVALTVDNDQLTSPANPAGAVVASLDATEAERFAGLCEQYARHGLPTVVGEDNRLRVMHAATA
jgi:hypothetical protein